MIPTLSGKDIQRIVSAVTKSVNKVVSTGGDVLEAWSPFQGSPRQKGRRGSALRSINKNAAQMPATLSAVAVRRIGGTSYRSWVSDTPTPGAGDNTQIKVLSAIGAELLSLDATEDDKDLILDRFQISIEAFSTSPFVYTPFLVIMENGETITTTSNCSTSCLDAADAAIAGRFVIVLGEEQISTQFFDNATRRFFIRATFNFTNLLKKFLLHTRKTIQEETNTLVCSIGHHSVAYANNIAIQVDALKSYEYHYSNAKLVV